MHTAWTSNAAPCRTPSRAWTIEAVEGKVLSGVVVARTMRSMSSAVILAVASAARAAASARSAVVSPSAAIWRCLMPVRAVIHSSLVSTMRARSSLVRTRSGR